MREGGFSLAKTATFLVQFEALMDHYLSTTNIDPMDLDKSEAQDDGTADGASLVLPCWDDTSTAGQTSTTATPIKKVVSSTKKKLQQRRKSAPKAAKPMAVKKRRKSSLSKKYEHSDEESDEQESDDDYQCCDL